jgi:hypothetical protein
MNEIEVRARLREAFGEATYPPSLKSAVEARLGRPAGPAHRHAMSILAAVLAVLIVASLVYVRLQSTHSPRPAAPSPTATPQAQIPAWVFEDGELGAAKALISRPNVSTSDGHRTVTIVGAYADPWRTVLILRAVPATNDWLAPEISDDLGPFNVGASIDYRPDGWQVPAVWQGPHAGPDGVAHLRVTIQDAGPPPFFGQGQASPARGPGVWDFSFDLKVQPAAPLSLQPALTSVGSWKFTVEAFELTPSVIYFQAVIRGASSSDISSSTFTLADEAGSSIKGGLRSSVPVDGSATVTRVNLYWTRPAYATTLRLRINGQYSAMISIPPPPQP